MAVDSKTQNGVPQNRTWYEHTGRPLAAPDIRMGRLEILVAPLFRAGDVLAGLARQSFHKVHVTRDFGYRVRPLTKSDSSGIFMIVATEVLHEFVMRVPAAALGGSACDSPGSQHILSVLAYRATSVD